MTVLPNSTISFILIKYFTEFLSVYVADFFFLHSFSCFFVIDNIFYQSQLFLLRAFLDFQKTSSYSLCLCTNYAWFCWYQMNNMLTINNQEVYIYFYLWKRFCYIVIRQRYFLKQIFHIYIDNNWSFQIFMILSKLKYYIVCHRYCYIVEIAAVAHIFMQSSLLSVLSELKQIRQWWSTSWFDVYIIHNFSLQYNAIFLYL